MTWKENYDFIGNDHKMWRASADSLIVSGYILHEYHLNGLENDKSPTGKAMPTPNFMKVLCTSKMMYGFGIECLIKAVYTKEGNKITNIGKGTYKPMIKKNGHDLNKLSDEINFTRNDKEINLLARLTKIMISIGRYPIGTHYSVTDPGEKQNRHKNSIHWAEPEDNKTLSDIIEKLNKRIKSS